MKSNHRKLVPFRRIGLIGILLLIQCGTVAAQSTELDKQLGKENAASVASQMGIYELEPLKEYVTKVGMRLVEQLENNPFTFQFHVVDDPIPNAFALPGGYIYVTRGILTIIASEDELAGVLGHEIIHSYNRHAIKQMRNSIFPTLLEIPGKVVGAVIDEDLGTILNAPIVTSNSLLLASYSRKHETEADELGVALAAKAGYNPVAMAATLQRLSKTIEILTNKKESKSYFDDHPYTPDRVTNIVRRSKSISFKPAPKISTDFPAPMDGMVFGENPSKGVFLENLFLHPDMGFAITFPRDWETSNRPEAVGAVHPDRQAAIFLGVQDANFSPQVLAKKMKDKIREEYGSQYPMQTSTITLSGQPAHVLTVIDDSGSETMALYVLWVKLGGNLFQLIGFAPKAHEKLLENAAMSLHTITATERKQVNQYVIKVVDATRGTSMQDLTRKNAPFDISIESFINGVAPDQEFDQDRKVKTIATIPYK